MINQEWIKAEAEHRGCPVTDLLALARQNDPFYVGTPSSRAQGQRRYRGNKPGRIFYISDFDPAGYSMPCAVSRKIEYLLQAESLDLDVKLQRLLLNREHVEQYRLPRTPIKNTERRAASFEARHGEGAVELDALEALHAGVLSRIVTNVLSHFYSEEAAAEARVKERLLRQAIRSHAADITARYTPEIEAIREMNRELAAMSIPDLEGYEPDRAEPDADDKAFDWLFDSNRGYLEQIAVYKEYSRGPRSPDSECAA